MSADAFPVADLIRTAGSAEERARILLRLPDGLALQMARPLLDACQQAHFELGVDYLTVRIAAMCAIREPDGELPERPRLQVELYRQLMCRLAGVTP